MCRTCLPPSIWSTFEPEYAPQRVSEGSTRESKKPKEVGVTPLDRAIFYILTWESSIRFVY
jgi:hypothetical protein